VKSERWRPEVLRWRPLIGFASSFAKATEDKSEAALQDGSICVNLCAFHPGRFRGCGSSLFYSRPFVSIRGSSVPSYSCPFAVTIRGPLYVFRDPG
jgi:hypothetical protein